MRLPTKPKSGGGNSPQIAIILGTGKSLNDLPRELLDKYPSYGSNYIGLAGIQPTYYACRDYRLLEDYDGISETAKNAEIAYFGPVNPKTDPIYSIPHVLLSGDNKDFSEEKSAGGGTITYTLLKLAYYDECDIACLWGVDFDNKWEHFRDDYPCPGNLDRKVDAMIYHMELANKVYRKAGKRIINFSLPSVLDNFFDRCSFEEVFNVSTDT